jgi:hypothetical protein
VNKDERMAELKAKLADGGRTERIWVRGSYEELHVWKAPTDLLYLNDDNRRFRAEAQGVAAELNRTLDPRSNPQDEESVISLLLDRNPMVAGDKVVGTASKEAKALLQDWEKRGQEQPFWIRPDGLVFNGNRRLAMIKREQATRGATFYDWVEVLVFPEEEYDDEVLFDLEAAEQLTEGLKVRYSDINVLLTLRDAAEQENIDWGDDESIQAVAASIQHLVPAGANYAYVQLNAIRYMDLYLEDIGCPRQYHRVQRMVERFRDVGKTMVAVARDDPGREDQALAIMFAAVQANSKHPEIRALKRLWRTKPDDFDKLAAYIQELEGEGEPEEEEASAEPDPELAEDEDEDEEAEEEAEPPVAPDYPTRSVKRAIDTAVQGVLDAKSRDKRAHVLSAAARLEEISEQDLAAHVGDTAEGRELRKALQTIVGWADEVRPLADTDGA